MHRYFLLPIFLFLAFNLSAQKKADGTFRIAFYNVENLFDLEDDPKTNDDDFTPEGRQKWTADRYQTKLDRIGEVMSGMGYPALMGMAEVENATVLKDLCRSDNLSRHNYQFVHFDSPDFRGIDVALIYQKEHFEVLETETIEIDFPLEVVPEQPDYTTRDVLIVKGILGKKETVTIVIAHFPSRRGGVQASEPKRLFVASQIKKKLDGFFAENKNEKVIMMGDFNDETTNKSITETLAVGKLNSDVAPGYLYNCFSELDAQGLGSYNYRGNWNMLDQIMVSSNFLDAGDGLKHQGSTIFREEKMMFKHDKYGPTPSRTYGGPNYYGGYSDHLPVYIELKSEK